MIRHGQPRDARRETHDVGERHDLRPAQLVGRTDAHAPGERLYEGCRDIAHVHRREARAGARQRQRRPAVWRSSPAKRLVSESRGPKITLGRKIVTPGCGLSGCGGGARNSASAAPLVRR